jgi:predicted transcriptional regulator
LSIVEIQNKSMAFKEKLNPTCTSVRFAPTTLGDLDQLAEETNLPITWHIRKAVSLYLAEIEKERGDRPF